MKNKEISRIFYEIADFLEIKDVKYKPRAYRKAARNIEAMTEDIENVYERGELEEIDGVGEAIAGKISEYLETDKLEYYEDLKDELSIDIEGITSIEGIGPKSAKKLYEELDIKNLDELKKAAKEGEVARVKGFGEKSQENILENIEDAKKRQKRRLLGMMHPTIQDLKLRLSDNEVFDRITIVGSYRRRKPTIGDVDILALSREPKEAMDAFCGLEEVDEVLVKGDTKSSIVISGGLQVDLRIVGKSAYGSGLLYFTGSKDHNVALRSRAKEKDWKLNEYGLFDPEDEKLAGETEEQVYQELNLSYIAPELRENTGEIEVAGDDSLPDLVEEKDIRGDLQIHTNYSDGSVSVKDMAQLAEERNLEYILISDHGPSLKVASGLSEEEFRKQRHEVDKVNDEVETEILHGIEANITENGLDISEEWCEDCDMLCVAMHDRPDNPTERILSVFEDYPIDILVHPLGRKLLDREPLDLNLDRIFDKAEKENIAIEINAQPERLDLDWQNVKSHRGEAKYVISTDAHSTVEMNFMHLGVSQARRGWCEESDILNTRKIDGVRSYLNG